MIKTKNDRGFSPVIFSLCAVLPDSDCPIVLRVGVMLAVALE